MATYTSSAYNMGGYKKYRAVLVLSQSSATGNSSTTISWTVKVEMQYAAQYGVGIKCSGAASGSSTGALTSSHGATWTTVASRSGTLVVTGTTSTQTKSFTATAYGTTYNGWGSAGGSVSITKSVTVPALASYTIKYDANGGGGAPPAQTKYYGKNLTLSSTTPTRSGYSFDGWYTAASGGSKVPSPYTTNGSATLYAHWTPITYPVVYDLNDGVIEGKPKRDASNKPENQTKVFGTNLTLRSTVPVRECYKFKGWATAANGPVVYPAGGTYSVNNKVTLYAVWEDNWYHVAYDKNLPDDETSAGEIPGPTFFDISNENTSTYTISDGTGFFVDSNDYYIYSFKYNGIEYGLGTVYTPSIGEKIVFQAYWVKTYRPPRIDNRKDGRLDKYGNFSLGGKDFLLTFTAIPAQIPQTGTETKSLIPKNTSFSVQWSSDGNEWFEDIEHWKENSNENNSNEITPIITSDQKVYYRKIINVTDSDYKYYKITLEDVEPYYKAVGGFDQTKTYYTYSETRGYEEVISPSAGSIDSYFEKYDEYSDSTGILEVPARNVPDSLKDLKVINPKCSRIDSSHRTVNFNFNWTPYYDGNENYVHTIRFYFEALPYIVVDNEKIYEEPILVQKNVTDEGEQGNHFLEGSFAEQDGKGIPIDHNAELYLRKVESFIDDDISSGERVLNILLGNINLGGFPVHINEAGTGISLFGLATSVNGFEVNAPSVINNTLNVNGNIISPDMTTTEIQSFINGLGGIDSTFSTKPYVDYIIEEGQSGKWTYRKWSSGIAEAWGRVGTKEYAITRAYGSAYYTGDTFSLPSNIFVSIDSAISDRCDGESHNGLIATDVRFINTNELGYFIWNPISITLNVDVAFIIKGRWKE